MLNQLLRSFVRAYGRGVGYQAARRTGWLVWPLLLAVVGFVIAWQLGLVDASLLGPLHEWLPLVAVVV